MKRADLLLACVVFLYGSSPMFGGTPNSQTRRAVPAAPRAVEGYSGVIMSLNGDRFILRDDSNDMWYHLDDQQQAGKFLGKKVWVAGKLDGRTDVIHVEQITEMDQ
jgi:uncharacterized protein YdeI (BOF family)